MSLDRYVAGPNGELDFFTTSTDDANKYSDLDQLKMLEERIDLMIIGRNTYNLFVDYWPTAQSKGEIISIKLNSLNKVIFSNSLTRATWGDWPDAEIASGNAVDNVQRLKSISGKDIVLWGSISLSQSLMQHDLIDEYHIQLCPVLLGAGRSLFSKEPTIRNLILKHSRKYDSGVIQLQYERSR